MEIITTTCEFGCPWERRDKFEFNNKKLTEWELMQVKVFKEFKMFTDFPKPSFCSL